MKTINESWLDFRKSVIAPDAPRTQAVEMQKAFYAGYADCFCSIMALLDFPEKKAAAGLSQIVAEIEAWSTSFEERILK